MQELRVSITPDQTSPVIKLSQGDVGRWVQITLYDEQGLYELPLIPDDKIFIHGTKPSGLGFTVPCQVVDTNGGVIKFQCTAQMTSECGRFPVEVTIKETNWRTGSANMEMWVERSPHPDGTIDGQAPDYVPVFTALVNRAETAAASAEEASAIAVAAVQNSAYGFFHIEDADGHLYLQKTDTFDDYASFLIDRNGHLNVTIGGL